MSGSLPGNVGLFVGKFGLPDIDSLFEIIGLDTICRVCRASIRVESRQKSKQATIAHQTARNLFKTWGLNDARR